MSTNPLAMPVSEMLPLQATFKQEAAKFHELVQGSKSILISSTLTSDGDSIGGQIGLAALCRAINPSVKIAMIDESPVPARYQFIEGTEDIIPFDQWTGEKDWDLGIVCDGGVERTGVVAPLFDSIDDIILVDHHAVGSELSYQAKLLDLDVSSTCELVFHLFEEFRFKVSKAVAEALYIGIVFDTGFFKHNLTKPRTHIVASRLIDTGIDFSSISDRALLERTWEAQLLLKQLLDNMKLSPCKKIIISSWSKKELDEIQSQDGDSEGMINQLYFTEGVQVVALFSEIESGQIKVSFRSKGQLNVADFARSLNPQGGGHVRAAGCSLEGDLETIKADVMEKLMVALASGD